MLRILDYCPATTRTSLQGIDYFTWAGGEGFSILLQITEKLTTLSDGQDNDWAMFVKSQIKESRHYLKLDYKLHLKEESRVPDHCLMYALSDPDKPAFSAAIAHPLNLRCPRCEAMATVIKEIGQKVEAATFASEHEKQEIIYEYEKATKDIIEMKKHILRTVRQDQARKEILESLAIDSVLITADFAMKHLPIAGRVPQNEWFAQRGVSWHVIHVIARDETGTGYRTRIYIHVFDSVAQDSAAVIAILNSALSQIKKELPHIKSAFIRSDNAGCYKSSQTIAAIAEISANSGISIKRWDFSDPQSGKGACDRAAATIKDHVRLYAAENNRCGTASEFISCANSYNGIKSVTIFYAEMKENTAKKNPTISGITSYNNFEFRAADNGEQTDIVVWQAYKIGVGFALPQSIWKNKKLLHELKIKGTYTEGAEGAVNDKTHWKAVAQRDGTPEPSSGTSGTDARPTMNLDDDGDDENSEVAAMNLLFPCPEVGCSKTYQSQSALEKHLDSGKHYYRPEKMSLKIGRAHV